MPRHRQQRGSLHFGGEWRFLEPPKQLYRFAEANRRRTRHAAFDTLLGIGARTTPVPYRVLIRRAA